VTKTIAEKSAKTSPGPGHNSGPRVTVQPKLAIKPSGNGEGMAVQQQSTTPDAVYQQLAGNVVKKDPKKKVNITKVKLTVTWGGIFDGDTVNKPDKKAEVSVQKDDAKGAVLATGTGDGSLTIEVKKEDKYFINVKLKTKPSEARYENNSTSVKYTGPAQAESDTVDLNAKVKLPVGPERRWNPKSVEFTWRERKINPDLAGKVQTTDFFGKKVKINELVIPRAESTNTDFLALPEEEREEISSSVVIAEGVAKRTTSSGEFSDHSLGTAIDMNYNLATKQNDHLKPRELKPDKALLLYFQKIARKKEGMEAFDLWKDKGQKQLDASDAFVEAFPAYFRALIQPYTENHEPKFSESYDERNCVDHIYPRGIASKPVVEKSIFQEFSIDSINKAIKAAQDRKKTADVAELQYIKAYWSIFKAWIEGAKPKDGYGKTIDVLLKGVIPIHQKILELMLKNGWDWGGDWPKAKDYMHFEDAEATRKLQLKDKPHTEEQKVAVPKSLIEKKNKEAVKP